MNILITGAAGFIGSNLCKRLLAQGHKIWAVDNLLTGRIENLEPFQDNPDFKFLASGTETNSFLEFCSGTGVNLDRVYHFACATGVPNIETLGEEMLMASSQGTWNVLRVANKSNARLLFTSSSEIYGEPLVTPQDESYTGNVDPVGWRANYEEGKRFSETLVAHFVRRYKLNAVIVRLFNVYGPNMSLGDTRVISRFAVQALSNIPLTVQGDGGQSRTFCFVEDILDGFETAISKGEAGSVYNLGSDVQVTIKEFANIIINLTGSKSVINYVPRPSHDHSSRMPVLNKIKSLGWRDQIDLVTGLKITLEDFRKRLGMETEYAARGQLQPQPQPQT